MKNLTQPIHPGEILADELETIGMTAASLAVEIGVPKNRLYAIVNEQRGMTAEPLYDWVYSSAPVPIWLLMPNPLKRTILHIPKTVSF